MEAALTSFLLDDAAVASFLQDNGDISVTKFMDSQNGDISVTKFMDS
jgi:hypothetical protein